MAVVPGPFVPIHEPWVLKLALDALAGRGARGTPEYRQLYEDFIGLCRAQHQTQQAATAPSRELAAVLDVEAWDPGSFLTVNGTAERLGFSLQRTRAVAARLGGVKVDGVWRIPVTGVEEWATRKRSA